MTVDGEGNLIVPPAKRDIQMTLAYASNLFQPSAFR
jgi:hypothetical protein